MSVSPELLMRYYDGEVSPDEALAVEAELERHPELSEQLAGMEQAGDFVRALAERREQHAPIDIAEQVMSRVALEAKSAAPPALERKRKRLFYIVPAAASALALAASVALWINMNRTPSYSVRSMESAVRMAHPEAPIRRIVPPPPFVPAVEDVAQVAIESVDFGAKNGAIFVVSGDGNETPVVWLNDDVGTNPRRIESL